MKTKKIELTAAEIEKLKQKFSTSNFEIFLEYATTDSTLRQLEKKYLISDSRIRQLFEKGIYFLNLIHKEQEFLDLPTWGLKGLWSINRRLDKPLKTKQEVKEFLENNKHKALQVPGVGIVSLQHISQWCNAL